MMRNGTWKGSKELGRRKVEWVRDGAGIKRRRMTNKVNKKKGRGVMTNANGREKGVLKGSKGKVREVGRGRKKKEKRGKRSFR